MLATVSLEMFRATLVILVVLCARSWCRDLGCLDENGNIIDWIYFYKLPQHVSKSGADFLYLHANSNGWQLSNQTIDEKTSMPGRLISEITADDLAVFYNDQPPDAPMDATSGHTKGVVAGNTKGGYWLIHSVPHYPPADYNNYSYPSTGHIYGQSFLCVSVKSASELDRVGSLMSYNEPHIYLGQVPVQLQNLYPNLRQLTVKKPWITEPPFFLSLVVANFTTFAKGHLFQKEIYVDWVAPTLRTDLLVESWLHGGHALPSDCEKPFR